MLKPKHIFLKPIWKNILRRLVAQTDQLLVCGIYPFIDILLLIR